MNTPLKDVDRQELNNLLSRLKSLKEEIARAKKAGVSSADNLENRCLDCEQRVASLKATYFPNKR